jgi:hypothetical protein
MLRALSTLPARRLWTLAVAVCAVALGAGIAQAALSSRAAQPPAKPLARAVHDALAAPAAPGITARISFVNHLLPSGSVSGQAAGSPLLSGASGRLWLTRGGRFRLELQSDSGDVQIVCDGSKLTVYDATSNTVYEATLPAGAGKGSGRERPPTVGAVGRALNRLAAMWTLSGAHPAATAGRPAYTVRIAPKDGGGLLGAAELAWDAARGVPLRAAVYARGQSSPVVELAATDVSYGPVAASDVSVSPPAGAKVVRIASRERGRGAAHAGASHAAHAGASHAAHAGVHGLRAVSRRLGFGLIAPAQLAGMPRSGVHLVSVAGGDAALTTYGHGLGTIAVLERRPAAGSTQQSPANSLPSVDVGGATGHELATALGTVVTFERGGVSYVVAGSVPPAAAESAARGLR